MKHEFDKKYPEFKNNIGIKFSQIKTDTQTLLLAEWMKAGQWEKVNDGKEFIDPFMRVNALNGNSFHEWLLTNPEERAFDLWKSIRNHAKETKTYKVYNWKNSAALISYANLPERLCALDLEEWSGSINVFALKARGIKFHSAANVSDKIKESIENDWFNSKKRMNITPIDCACYHGSDVLINFSLETFKTIINNLKEERLLPITWRKHNMIDAFVWYIHLGDEVSLSTLTNALHTIKAWSSVNNYLTCDFVEKNKEILLKKAFLNFEADRIKNFLKSVPDEVKNNLISSKWDWLKLKLELLENGKLKHLDLVQFLEKEYINKSGKTIKDILNFDIKHLSENIENGNTFGVCWLLERHPEWLEKGLVYKDNLKDNPMEKGNTKELTPLVIAAMHGHKELVDLLLEKGASTTPLKDIMNYTPFKNSTYYKRFMSIAEHVLLNQKAMKKINSLSENTIQNAVL